MRLALPCCLIPGLSACGRSGLRMGGLQPGGRYPGVPDTITGDPQRNQATGTITSDGTVWTRRDGYLTTPRRY